MAAVDEGSAWGSKAPHIVIDTTEFFRDLKLTGKSFTTTLEHAHSGMFRVCVPEIVIAETARHYRTEAIAVRNERLAELRDLLQAIGKVRSIPRIDIGEVRSELKEEIDRYGERLREKLKKSGVIVLPHPSNGHTQTADWYIARRKPFVDHGKGYADALIWASVLELATQLRSDDLIVLVTNNKSDFCKDEGVLAEPLLADLAGIDDYPEVRVYPSLDAMLDGLGSWIEKRHEPLKESRTEVGAKYRLTVRQLLGGPIVGACEGLVGKEIADPNDEMSSGLKISLSLPTTLQSPIIDNLGADVQTLDWYTYEEFEGGTLLGEASIEADVAIGGDMFTSDYYIAAEGEDEIDILDADWNDHMARVSVSRRVELTFQVRVTPDSESVDYIRFESARSLEIE